MKKQFITGVLLLAVTACGFSTFTSCKDTDEDFRNEMLSQQTSLKATLQALQEHIDKCHCDNYYNKQDIENMLKLYATQQALDDLKELIGEVTDPEKGSVIDRLEELESVALTDDEADAIRKIAAIVGIADNLKDFFGPDGEFTINQLKELLYGTDNKPGLVQWFKDKDGNDKWSVADFQKAVDNGIWLETKKAAVDEVKKLYDKGLLDENMLTALKENYEGIVDMYNTIWEGLTDDDLPEGADHWWNYAEVIQKIIDNAAAIEELQKDVENLLNRINDMVTSLVLQATSNPVFGSFNTPFGINSMVLITPYGDLSTGIDNFPVNPADGKSEECYMNVDIDWSNMLPEDEFYTVRDERGKGKIVALNEGGNVSLGNLWFTVNPGTVKKLDINGFALVNSVDKGVVELEGVEKDNETVLKFGIGSRAGEDNGNGLYTAEAVVTPDNLDAIKIHIQPGLVQSLKDAVKNHTASDMVSMLKAVYNQLQDICDANALRYTYTTSDKDENGKWIESEQKVYSNYGIAATAFKPLSYATLKGASFGKHLPTFGSISIPEDLVDLDLGTFTVDGNNFKLNLHFGQPTFEYKEVADQVIEIYDGDRLIQTITIKLNEDIKNIFDQITGAIEAWIGTGNDSLDARVEKSIWYALFNDPDAVDPIYPYDPNQSVGVVADLVKQVNDMMGSIQDKLDSLVAQINKDYLGKVNSLINKYNTIAERINNVLDDPNHYLQSVMLYRKAGKLALSGTTPEVELPFGILSTDPKRPTQFKGAGEAISLWATSYTFETVAPAFKKFVGVVSVKDENGDDQPELVKEANKTLAKVMNGDQNRVALNVKNAKGGVFTYEVAYQALDYTGHTSTVKCYLQVVR